MSRREKKEKALQKIKNLEFTYAEEHPIYGSYFVSVVFKVPKELTRVEAVIALGLGDILDIVYSPNYINFIISNFMVVLYDKRTDKISVHLYL